MHIKEGGGGGGELTALTSTESTIHIPSFRAIGCSFQSYGSFCPRNFTSYVKKIEDKLRMVTEEVSRA